MPEDKKTMTKEVFLRRLKDGYEVTLDYLNNYNDGALPSVQWFIYESMMHHEEVLDYMSSQFPGEVTKLYEELDTFVKKTVKETFLADEDVMEKNFPWSDDLEAYDNLNRKLSIDEMAEYNAKGTYLYDWVKDRIAKKAMTTTRLSPKTLELYQKKKTIEEEMIRYIESLPDA